MNSWPQWWQEFYGELPPIGHILRESIIRRWFRIHSLPESKRYPENEEEYALLLARHNTIATEVLGDKAQCTLFISRFNDDSPCKNIINGITPEYCGFYEEPSDPLDDMPERIYIWQSPIVWQKALSTTSSAPLLTGANIMFLLPAIKPDAPITPTTEEQICF